VAPLLVKNLSLLFILSTLAACLDAAPAPAPPTIEITSPRQGALLNSTAVRVEGRATNTAEVFVQDRPVAVVAGVWSATVNVGEGQQTINARILEASDEVSFSVDASPPVVTITSPARAAWLNDPARVSVRGIATDAVSGVAFVKINEQIVTLAADGSFEHELDLERGLNTLTVVAQDQANHLDERIIGVIHGDTEDPDSLIDPAFSFVVTRPALNLAVDVIRDLLTPALVKDLVDSSLMLDRVMLTRLDFAPLEISVTPRTDPVDVRQPGFLDMRLTLRDVVLAGTFTLAGQDYGLEVNVAQATLATRLYIRADGQGGLGIEFTNATLDLPQGSLTWRVIIGDGALSESDARLLGDLVERVVQVGFQELLNERVIDQLYDPDILKRQIELLGRTLSFELQVQRVIINDSGVVVRAAVALPADQLDELPVAPGALVIPRGDVTTPKSQAPMLATTDAAALNRLSHGVWRSGLLNQRLEGAAFAGFELPFGLTSSALALLVDGRILDAADPGDLPAGIALRPQLPPIVTLDAAAGGSGVILRLGELHVDILLDINTASPKRLVTLAAFFDLALSIDVEGTQLTLAFDVDGRFDTVEEPLFDLRDQEVEGLFGDLLALVPELISQQLSLTGEADLEWLKLTNPTLEVHGLSQDQLTVGLDATR
jgi:hypothetical protein